MNALRALMLWGHLAAAVMAIGGVYFMRLILLPILCKEREDKTSELASKVSVKFRKMIWHSIGLLLVSGGVLLYLAWPEISYGPPMKRHLLELKILLALVLFANSFLITLPIPSLEGFRRKTPKILLINLGLAMLILLLVGLRQAL